VTALPQPPLTAGAPRHVTVASGGLPATGAVPLRIGVPAGTAPGTYRVTVRIAAAGGPTASRTVRITVRGAGA